MSKSDTYRVALCDLDDWDPYLLKASGLPGPRGNLELAQVVADLGDPTRLARYAAMTAVQAPVNTPGEFLTCCGVLGFGRLLAEGETRVLSDLRGHASDVRWRVREAVAMALQRWGDVEMEALLAAMDDWAAGTPFEQRAAAAALCEPRLLRVPAQAAAVLRLLDGITTSMGRQVERRNEAFQALRKGMGYCWSVAVVANPAVGRPLMERWLESDDKDIRWVMRENLGKNRLIRMDAAWVAWCRDRI